MSAILIITIYLIGCVLSYGRIYAAFYEIEEDYLDWDFPMVHKGSIIAVSIMSWVGFMVGVIVYFTDSEKYFLKWTDKDLQNRYYSKYRKS